MNASAAEIENSYRTLVKVWHPDRFQSDLKLRLAAEERLKEINAAHEFLLSQPPAPEPPPPGSPKPRTHEPQHFRAESFVDPDPVDPEPAGAELDELRGILRRQRRSKMRLPRFLMKVGFVIGAIAVVAILWLLVDSILSANPRTAGAWEQYKAEISRDIQSSGVRLWSNATDDLHTKSENQPAAAVPAPPEPAPANPPANAAPAGPRSAAGPPHIKVSGSGQGATPYVTSGLTPMEVLAILGNPSSSSGERMFYKGSEIDFRNGHVVGWKIDPGTAPIRVKLWPNAAPAPGLTNFAIGSSKSDVIALQGTPTLFSDNKFGYGNSVVLFQNDRVVGWNEDPASVRLRVAH